MLRRSFLTYIAAFFGVNLAAAAPMPKPVPAINPEYNPKNLPRIIMKTRRVGHCELDEVDSQALLSPYIQSLENESSLDESWSTAVTPTINGITSMAYKKFRYWLDREHAMSYGCSSRDYFGEVSVTIALSYTDGVLDRNNCFGIIDRLDDVSLFRTSAANYINMKSVSPIRS